MSYKPITFRTKGNFKKTNNFMKEILHRDYMSIIEKYAKEGLEALIANTPIDTGLTAASWSYEIVQEKDKTVINWKNSNIQGYVNIALILQYGHATRNGGWVKGVDYINPTLQPIFDKMAEEVWDEVTG